MFPEADPGMGGPDGHPLPSGSPLTKSSS